jgi:hypothetical protein
VTVRAPSRVSRRDLFYNRSKFDGYNAAIDAKDFDAVALDKQALLPGQTATFANYTTYSRGINGVIVTLSGEVAPTAADFVFRKGSGGSPGGWVDAGAPSGFEVRPLAGGPGAAVVFTFPDGAIRNTWLQVTVLANERTGLAATDVFYFGNLVGDTGNSTTAAAVDGGDLLRTRAASSVRPVDGMNRFDFNRDGVVNVLDQTLCRANQGRSIELIAAPGAVASVQGTAFRDGTPISLRTAARRRGVLGLVE